MSTGKALGEFIAEATEIVDALGKDLLALDERRGEEPDPERVNALFRGAHSLKGLSGMFGQDRVAHLAHAAEDVLDRLRLGRVALAGEVLDALVEVLDAFGALLAEGAQGHETPALTARAQALGERLLKLGSAPAPVVEDPLDRLELDPGVRNVFTEYEEHRLRENVRKGVPLWRARAAFDLADFDTKLTDLNARIKPVGEVISTLPSAEPGGGTGISFDLLFGSREDGAALAARMEGLPVTLTALTVRPPAGTAAAPPPAADAPARAKRAKGARKARGAKGAPAAQGPGPGEEPADAAVPPPLGLAPAAPADAAAGGGGGVDASLRSLTQTVRVDIRRLDGLMNTVGELLLIKGNVQRLAEGALAGAQAGAVQLSRAWGQELAREARALERKLDALQAGLLEARMVPLGQVFDKLARLVRRVAREAGKELELVLTGSDVELDKLIVEELSDPLMHIIRNAIDHGVEAPDARVAAGKPRRATLSLRATQRGNHVVIEVEDDGGGMDELRIREVALQRGLITPEKAAELDRRDLLNLVFLPGFSTARGVTELSGRGVGLDVVKNNIANLSGIIDVWSERGRGTRFTLTLPVTLAIIRALVVGVSGRTYAVPLNSVLEILSITPGDVRTVERREVLDLRGTTLPFTRLARMFGLPERELPRRFVVVVGLAQERLGIAVDELFGQQDIVTKPLGGRLRDIRGVSGATDLGNRRTVLVLDVGALMEEGLAAQRRRA